MNRLWILSIILIAALSFSLSCNKKEEKVDALALAALISRSYYLGLTPFPYDISGVDRIEWVYDRIRTDADLMAHHFDNGIPWDQALAGTPYPSKVTDDWYFRKSHTPAGHKLYVAVTPINGMRDGLAPLWNATGDNQPLTGTDWESRTFNSTEVKIAYLYYCRSVIDYFNPDYIAVGVEVNLVKKLIPAQWDAYLELQGETYAALKALYPNLPIFVTLTGIDLVEGYSDANHADQMAALSQVIDHTDYYAISLHPFFAEVPGGTVPADMADRIFSLNTKGKPACITETSFPAEELTMTYYDPDITLAGTPEKQRYYFSYLLEEAQNYGFVFVVNFLVRDYDVLWSTPAPGGLGSPEDINKAWRDTGFYDQDGNARPALEVWKARLALPRW
ncbi:MAG: hypothetical protein KA369_13505 [Spirochaetes bacterium]|nr:hypothetical protein [Spirochaetota bacterium]